MELACRGVSCFSWLAVRDPGCFYRRGPPALRHTWLASARPNANGSRRGGERANDDEVWTGFRATIGCGLTGAGREEAIRAPLHHAHQPVLSFRTDLSPLPLLSPSILPPFLSSVAS